MNRRLILSREDFGSSHVAPAAAPARYELISSHYYGVIAVCAPCILVLRGGGGSFLVGVHGPFDSAGHICGSRMRRA